MTDCEVQVTSWALRFLSVSSIWAYIKDSLSNLAARLLLLDLTLAKISPSKGVLVTINEALNVNT